MNKIYIDLATRMGWASLDENGAVTSGYIELDKNRHSKTYTTSQCRKTLPKQHTQETSDHNWNMDENSDDVIYADKFWNTEYDEEMKDDRKFTFNEKKDKYCVIGLREVIYENDKQNQLRKFKLWLEDIRLDFNFRNDTHYDINKVIIEEPNTTGKFSSRKTLALFGMADLVIGEYKEIKASVWFKWITNELPKFKVWKDGINSKNVDRKETSKAIASWLMNKEIKDDNEADSICMMFYDNQKVFMKYKAKAEEEIWN